MKIYKLKSLTEEVIIPREHIPFMIVSTEPILCAWAHITLDGEFTRSSPHHREIHPNTPFVLMPYVVVNSDGPIFITKHFNNTKTFKLWFHHNILKFGEHR